MLSPFIRNEAAVTDAAIRARTPAAVAEADKDHFIELALGEFKTLRPGNAVRFGIRPLELSI